MKYKKISFYAITILFLVLLFIFPYIINKLMSFSVTKIYGDTNTWISFLGSYIGAIISGFVTLLGVLLTVEFTKSETRKDKLPEKIDNLEESLDIIESNIEFLEQFNTLDTPENIARLVHFRELIFYAIGSRYSLIKKGNIDIEDFTMLKEKQIRKHLIKVNANAYISFRRFSDGLTNDYRKHIEPIENQLNNFQTQIIEQYKETDWDVIVTGHIANINISEEHRNQFNEIKAKLYFEERKYVTAIIDTFNKLKEELSDNLQYLRKELDY